MPCKALLESEAKGKINRRLFGLVTKESTNEEVMSFSEITVYCEKITVYYEE